MAFTIGETVQLKSGGPIMTVEDVDGEEGGRCNVHCVWFEKVGTRRVTSRDVFAAAILASAQPGGFSIGTIRRG
ncbi:YodC family protein [Sphingomonas sp. CFBP 8765]|uniref:YodC family protein n=1 Tax=Sphingomonas sp. CFBP 8765 TaxID=2775274 RepID=UPI00177E4102|nr:DUF2158 domain-containing protein [Sphingomonas sp. CFBP 8765]MBD8471551.1 DUF2158 domain-containing protein [Sphingomonas sp. CFBP 8765]